MSRGRVLRVLQIMPADPFWFSHIPRDIDRAAEWHSLYGDSKQDGDPDSLVECSDGAVFTSQDVWGTWE